METVNKFWDNFVLGFSIASITVILATLGYVTVNLSVLVMELV